MYQRLVFRFLPTINNASLPMHHTIKYITVCDITISHTHEQIELKVKLWLKYRLSASLVFSYEVINFFFVKMSKNSFLIGYENTLYEMKKSGRITSSFHWFHKFIFLYDRQMALRLYDKNLKRNFRICFSHKFSSMFHTRLIDRTQRQHIKCNKHLLHFTSVVYDDMEMRDRYCIYNDCSLITMWKITSN